MAATPPVCDFGWKAPDFSLPGTDGLIWALKDVTGPNGVLIMFICNHCPYVRSVLDRIIRDAKEMQALGIGVAAISSNDAADYPEDGFENMADLAAQSRFPFPYLYDESQAVARTYGAVCTPDFFGFNAEMGLQYRGRLDASGRQPKPGLRRDLLEAMRAVSETGHGPAEQVPSIGCSIKWKSG